MNLYETIFNTVSTSLAEITSDTELGAIAEAVTTYAETEISRNNDRTAFEHIDCSKGCSHCCVVFITVLMPEAVNIAVWLRENGLAEEYLPVLEERAAETRWVEEQDWSLMGKKCVFLSNEGGCEIYPVRPLLCRSVTSVSAGDCKNALYSRVMGEERSVLMNLDIKNTMETAFHASADSLKEAGIDNAGLELTKAVLCALKHEDIAERLKNGEKIRPS
jgi:Fe-S-cluster containining protein